VRAIFGHLLQRGPDADRRGTAAAIKNLLDAAEEPVANWRVYGIDAPLRSAAVLAARTDLLAIAGALESDDESPAQLVNCASWLAWSSDSPVRTEPADDDSDVEGIARRLRVAFGV
jgi:hypothetical protein